MTVAEALHVAKIEAIEFGRALRTYEAAIDVFRKATSDAERAELRPLVERAHAAAVAADARSKAAIASLELAEFQVN